MNWTDYTDQVDYATYDPNDNKLRIYSGRVPEEMYNALKEAGWQRAYQQGCFFAVWTPNREDVVLALCGEITDEDATPEERTEARAERFATYADNAARRSKEAKAQSDRYVQHIPFGQPILVGHHSEKAHRNALDKSWKAMGRSVEEYDRSQYWQRRAEAALQHREYRERPDVILRRIKKLETERRKFERERHTDVTQMRYLVIQDCYPDKPYYERPRYGELEDDERAQVDAEIQSRVERHDIWTDRWIEHLDGQIAYWQAFYNDVKPDAAPEADQQHPLVKGCWVRRGKVWAQVTRVNRGQDKRINSVSIDRDTAINGASWVMRKWDYTEIAEWREGRPE